MKKLLFVLLFAFSMTSCASPASGITEDITAICELGEGRLPGSPGNVAVQEYLEKKFSEAGLLPLEGHDTFAIPYEQTVFYPEEQTQTLTVRYEDGSQKEFYSGTDFYPYLGDPEFHGEVTTNVNHPLLSEMILISDEVPTETTPMLRIRSGDSQPARIGAYERLLSVSDTLFAELKHAVSLSLTGSLSTSEEPVHNVVGVLKGTQGENALVLSAHFDHVGGYGSTVYTGALDNASGVAVMLEILRQVSALPPASYDIIFCAFNGEEMGQLGSSAFAQLTLPYETINAINLDSIGWTENDTLTVIKGNSSWAEQISKALSDKGFICEVSEFGLSDHQALDENGIPAVTIISGGDVSQAIHLPSDTMEQVNVNRLQAVADTLSTLYDQFKLVEPEPLDDETVWREYAEEMINKYQPKPEEAVIYLLNESWWYARDISPIAGMENVRSSYPGRYIPAALGDFQFTVFYPQSLGFSGHQTEVKYGPYAFLGAEDPASIQEGVIALPENSGTSLNTIRYQNDMGIALWLTQRSLDDWSFLEEIYRRDNQLTWSETSTQHGKMVLLDGGVMTQVILLCEENGIMFSLCGDVENYDTETFPTVFELENVMKSSLDELVKMQLIP